jgi:AraC-like DNA-binding protein
LEAVFFMNPYQLLADSLEVRFLHIKQHELDHQWRINKQLLRHSVLWYLETGTFTLSVNDKLYTCKEGQMCVLPANFEITCRPISNELRLISINFDAEISFLSNRCWGHILNIPVVFEDTLAELAPIVREMLRVMGEPSPFLSLLMQSSLLRILFVLLQQSTSEQALSPHHIMDTRIHAIILYLLAHPHKMPEIHELAELVHVSESHLRKLFIQDMGQAPLQFVHRLKIEQAKKLISTSDKPISQIADELGVQNANYFTRMFKAKSGYTPQQYRQQFGLWLND